MSDSTFKKRKRSKRRRKKILMLTAFIIAIAGLLCALSFTVFFPVKNIYVKGNSVYSVDEIINECGINLGDNTLALSEDDVRINLQSRLPFIEGVEVSRKLSGNVTINVVEAKEIYCYKIGDAYYSTNHESKVLKEYTELPQGITFVEFGAQLNNKAVKYLDFGNKENEQFLYDVLSVLANTGIKIDYVNLNDRFEITALFDSKFTVNFGSDTYLKEKAAFFVAAYNSSAKKGESGRVNLSEYTPKNPQAYFDYDEK